MDCQRMPGHCQFIAAAIGRSQLPIAGEVIVDLPPAGFN
jgi:hypothetical protein